MAGDSSESGYLTFQNIPAFRGSTCSGISKHDELFKNLIFLIKDMEKFEVPVLRAKACFINAFYEDNDTLFIDIERTMKVKDERMIVDAFKALMTFITYYGSNTQLTKSLNKALELLTQPLRWGIIPHKKHSVTILREVIRFLPEINISSEIPILLEYFDRNYISYQQTENGSELNYLNNDIMLASALYDYFLRNRLEIPIILEKWKEITMDKNQFSDIANSWNS